MKLFVLAASLSVFGVAANAGNMEAPVTEPIIAATPAPTASFNWTGGYVGVQGGLLRGSTKLTGENLNNNNTMSRSFSQSGGMLGIYAGYNWHDGGNIVYGIEGEVSASNADGRGAGVEPPSFGFMRDRLEAEIRSSAAIRGRVGFAQNRTLFYVAGGLAAANTKITGFSAGGGSPFSETTTLTGWTIGLGVEHAITDQWTLRADFRHSDFGSKDYDFESANGTPHEFKHRLKTNEIRLGAAMRF